MSRGVSKSDFLRPRGFEENLHARAFGRPFRNVAERIHVEVGVEFAIQTDQDVLVELRSYALGVVVSGHQNFGGLTMSVPSSNASPADSCSRTLRSMADRVDPLEITDARSEIQDQLAAGNLAQKMKAVAEIDHHG